MLSNPEKIIFTILIFVTLYATYKAVMRLSQIIGKGYGKIDWKVASSRAFDVLVKVITMRPTFNLRIVISIFHIIVVWGFSYYLMVNLGDVLQGYISGFVFFGNGIIGNLYRFLADILSVGVLVGILAFLIRRFVIKDVNVTTRDTTLLHPKARAGILKDSAIVGGFVLIHVGSRFLGESFALALEGPDAWQPFASAVSALWGDWQGLEIARHVTFWMALGTIMAFIPYFPYSKHVHLFFAPLSFLVKPERKSIGELSMIDFEDESLEEFGASKLVDLSWGQIMDAYSCIMCYRCQEVCPAYETGKVLSPAALEINKRYYLNSEGTMLAKGEAETKTMVEWAISEEAVWACTSCGACIDICPVNNDPMLDIMDIRRSLVLIEDKFPEQLQTAFRGMERAKNPWGIPQNERMKWADGIEVPTIDENPEADILWWVGCAPATDINAQKSARAFAQILNKAGVNYAVLGEAEHCTGDSARRAGREDIFFELALTNVEILNEVAPQRIVTTCPHCLHTLLNEYPAYGGNYVVVHHTQFINELIRDGRIILKEKDQKEIVTYHDPCYLSRHNHIIDEPRAVLRDAKVKVVEMDRVEQKTFCCGAGGAQVWKEEEHGDEKVNERRYCDAAATGADTLTVSCPFCNIMMADAVKESYVKIEIRDIAEIVYEHISDE